MESENMSDISERVKEIVVKKLGVDAAKVVDSAHFVNDLGADSLDRAEMVMAFEDAFDFTIPDEDSAELATVGSVVEYLQKKAA